MTEKILLVDDEPNVLAGLKRQFRKQFDLEISLGGEQGLELVESRGPFAVIVSDMRMPGMDGIRFLSEVKERAPDSVRMMLTGNADIQTAIEAVNEGNVFRFLTKPCPPGVFVKALSAGIEQYRLIMAERELLEETLSGSVKMLTEILSLVNPLIFSRASRIRRYVRHIAVQLQLADSWQYEMAAMLSEIGCMTVPVEILDKIALGKSLSNEEQEIFSAHPSVGGELLAHIPRLESIARMVEGQQQFFEGPIPLKNMTREDTIALGAHILKVALAFDQLVIRGLSYEAALSKLGIQTNIYDPKVVGALENLRRGEENEKIMEVRVEDLPRNVVAVAYEDILAKNGLLLVTKGQELTYPVLIRLQKFSKSIGVKEPFRVQIMPVS